MALITIKKGAKARHRRGGLVREVHAEASNLLEENQGRVLVVYGDNEAQIIYEADETPPSKGSA
jgi:hypothetical protein